MAIGDRISNWLDQQGTRFGDRVGTWALDRLAAGMVKGLEALEPGAIEGYSTGLNEIANNPLIPEGIRAFVNKSLQTGNPISAVGGMLLMIVQSLGVLLNGSQPVGNIIRYEQDKIIESARLDPQSVMTAVRRSPILGEAFIEDLREQGWSDERLEVLRIITEFFPSPQDLVTWIAHEVFEPDSIERYGLADEFGNVNLDLFSKAGVNREQALNYWISHWQHASYNQVVEMLYRGTMTQDPNPPAEPTTAEGWAQRDAEGEAAMYQWYRLVEIPPFWRDRLTRMAWNIPTRVDVRRWYDMRTIDEAELYSIYHRLGYHGKDLENYVLWTKVYNEFPSLVSRWSNGWIGEDDVRARLAQLGVPAERIETMIEEKIRPDEAARVQTEKNLTKTEIYKGVKQDRITRDEATDLLQQLGYTLAEADYLLDVNIPVDNTDQVVAERQLSKTDIRNALKTGLISRTEAASKLADLRYSPANVDLLLKLFDAQNNPPTEDTARQASKADIIAGVKKGVITQEEAYVMLTDIGFAPEAANFILTVKAEESPFSPINFAEFSELTAKYRRASNMPNNMPDQALKAAADQLLKVQAEVDQLQREVDAEQAKIIPDQPVPETATAKLRNLQQALYLAQAELARVKVVYQDALAASNRQGG